MAIDRRAFLAALSVPAVAQAQPEPVIELSGAIAEPRPRRLTRSAVEALGLRELVTITPWTQGPQRFSGVPLGGLLDHVAATGASLRATALNDYAVSIARAGAVAADAFVATRLDGQPLSVRERGPFWIVFPWSERRDLDTAIVRQWAIWQVARIEVT
jgi:hypothetical protein